MAEEKDKCDFSGWATKNDIKCSDGRVLKKDAFKANDGQVVPLVWNHDHENSDNVLGHALLENRDNGVYAYCFLNDTDNAKTAKQLIMHHDICSLSIYANQLKQEGPNVTHGIIREVSLVLAGANPGASIENVMMHGDDSEDGALIYNDSELELEHSCGDPAPKKDPKKKEDLEHMAENPNPEQKPAPSAGEKTVAEVYATLNEEQKAAVDILVGGAYEKGKAGEKIEGVEDENPKEGQDMAIHHNAFEGDDETNKTEDEGKNELTHSEFAAILQDAKDEGSMKNAFLKHSITNVEYLYPEAQPANGAPILISRNMDWVKKVMNGVHHTPFSRVKSTAANITEDDARARGYIKGKQKVDEVISALKRKTEPQTIYKHQSMDRDDVIDITEFDVVAWIKSEMRTMLDEEIARAVLIGDGRTSSSDDKIDPLHIRPIYGDDTTYAIKDILTPAAGATDTVKANAFIDEVVRSRKNYKGSGNPALYTTEDMLSSLLLLKDSTGRRIYQTEAELATALRVSEIISVPVMEGVKRTEGSDTYNLLGIIVNLADYNIGADKGGAINMFDDFDIDYNKQKYLIETRCSGALVTPYSAIVYEEKVATQG